METKAIKKTFPGVQMSDSNGNVKWPFFLTTILAVIALVVSLSAVNVSKAEFSQFEKRFDENMTRLFKEIEGLKK